MGAGEIGTEPMCEFVDREQARGSHDGPLAMDPLGFKGSEPGTLDWQLVYQQTDARSCPFDRLVMRTDPGVDCLAAVPRRVVPAQDPDGNALVLQPGATPLQHLKGDGADWSALGK